MRVLISRLLDPDPNFSKEHTQCTGPIPDRNWSRPYSPADLCFVAERAIWLAGIVIET